MHVFSNRKNLDIISYRFFHYWSHNLRRLLVPMQSLFGLVGFRAWKVCCGKGGLSDRTNAASQPASQSSGMYHSAARGMMNACSKPLSLSLSQRRRSLWNQSQIGAWVCLSGSICLIGLFLLCDACMAHLLIGLLDCWMIERIS